MTPTRVGRPAFHRQSNPSKPRGVSHSTTCRSVSAKSCMNGVRSTGTGTARTTSPAEEVTMCCTKSRPGM
jgi:hypothetical protein